MIGSSSSGDAPVAAPVLAEIVSGDPVPVETAPARLPVEVFRLDNGMTFLLLPQPEKTTVAAGWVAKVGSANEEPGLTGITHMLEHMMFKGSRTVGARDLRAEERLMREQEALQDRIHELRATAAGSEESGELARLERRFQASVERSQAFYSPVEFFTLYAQAGAVGTTALTLQDFTAFTTLVPANKLELWFWMESDRLAEPVFRQFYTERQVVREERRQRAESTPTGLLQEELRRRFWRGHPYAWPTLGAPEDVERMRRADARRFFDTYYRPENLVATLVGRFDPAQAKRLARRYFGRLEKGRGEIPPAPVWKPAEGADASGAADSETSEPLRADCDCRTQVHLLFHTVPFLHSDRAPLEVLVGLLNGRTGRLHRSLVVEQGLAFSAFALQNAMRWGGVTSLTAEAKGDTTPEQLLAALEGEIEGLGREPPAPAELAKVRNQIVADAYRQLRDPSALSRQLLFYEALGDWRQIHQGPARTLAVQPEDVQRVVRSYFQPAGRSVGIFQRRVQTEGSTAPAGDSP